MTTDTPTILAYCAACNDDKAFSPETRTETTTIRGSEVKAVVNVLVCPQCGHVRDAPGFDSMLAFYNVYRRQHGLLMPEEIVALRERYDLSREALAKLLGMSAATLYRYEGGSLQDIAHDELLRSCRDAFRMAEIVQRHPDRLTDLQKTKFLAALEQLPEYETVRTYRRFAELVQSMLEAAGSTFVTKLNKLLFYADFLASDMLGQPITGVPYRAYQHGPVPDDYETLLDQMQANGLIEREELDVNTPVGTMVSGIQINLIARTVHPQYTLSDSQRLIVQHVARTFARFNTKDIREYSHKEDAWTQTPQKQVIDLRHAKTLKMPRPTLPQG